MSVATTATATVSYRTAGPTAPAGAAAPALVMVHGTGFGAEGTFGHLVEHFSADRKVVLPDFAGCGETVDDGGELTPELLAEQIVAVIEAEGGEPVDLVGFSLGAVVAATVAAYRPDLVRRLVLTAGWARPDHPYLATHMTTWAGLAGDPVAFGRFGTLTAFSPEFMTVLGPEALSGIIAGNRPTEGALRHIDLNLRADLRPLLPRITAETLVIGCTKDGTVPFALTRELADAVPGARFEALESGHVVVYEQPEAFVELVAGFTA
ncbi:alpha/beta fold hydrolase [Kitasatospora phosalacinea]|uniref:alpha/beta fold hydrolase n=1 Tax=Kitasatospora phosalacinea TaxID=2065 RepID=UPI00365DBE12